MPHQVHSSLGYHFLNAEDLPVFAEGVKAGVYEHPEYFDPEKDPAIPVTESELKVLITAERQAHVAYKRGGLAQKVPYIIARKLLVSKIDLMAGYVDVIAAGNPKIIILGGFEPTYFGDFAKPGIPGAPLHVTITNAKSTGILYAECESFGPAHQYGCIMTEGQPLADRISIDGNGHLIIPANQPYKIWGDFNHNRKKQFWGLTKGVEYYFYFYVVNNYGVSSLSEVVSRICL